MKVLKITLLTLLTLVVLLVVAVVAAVNLIDLNRHHDRIAQVVYDNTGRELQIEGELEWGVWPRLYLGGGPLVLGNTPGFGPEPFLRLESFEVGVTTWPLRRSEIHVDTMRLNGLTLNLERNQQGVGNWEDLTDELAADEPRPLPAPPKEPAGLPFAALALGGVHIDQVRVNWDDQVSGQQAQVSDLRLTIGALNFGEPMLLQLDFNADSNQPELAVAAEVRATLRYDLKAGHYSVQPLEAKAIFSGPTVPGDQAELNLHAILDLDNRTGRAQVEEFRLNGLGAEVKAALTMHDLEADIPGCQGEITVGVEDLVRLLAIFESPLADQLAGVRERDLRLTTEFTTDPGLGRVMVPRLEARLLGTTVSGRVEATDINSDRPRVQGGIRAEGPDLPALLAIVARLQPEADQDALARAVSGLRERGLLAEATFASEGEEIVIPHLYFRGLATELTVDARLGELAKDNPTVRGQARLEGRDLPMLLRVVGAFQGGPEAAPASGEEQPPGAELWQLADRVAAANHRQFAMGTAFTARPAMEQLTLRDFTATALGLEAKAELEARQLLQTPEFQLELELPPFNARQLLTVLGVEIPATADQQVLTSLALRTAISGTPERFTVKPLELQLDDSRISGEITVNDLTRPDAAFSLEIDRINLDRYLPPESDQQPPLTPETAAAGGALLPVEPLRQLRLDGNLQIHQLQISGLQIEDLTLGIKADDGHIRVQPLDAALYQGTMASTIVLDVRGQSPEIKATNRLAGVQAGPLLRDLTGSREMIRGRADVSYDLASRGPETEDLKANLGGEARFSFQDGAVVGVNIGRLLRQGTALARGRTLAPEEREAVTDFTTLTGSARITRGQISNQDLSMMSPLLRISGKGTAHLVSEEIDYLLTATLVATPEGQEGRDLAALRGIPVPIKVGGTFAEPTFRPDLGAAGLEELKQNLREQGVRALEGLLGGPREQPGKETVPEEQKEEPAEELEEGVRRLFNF